MFKSEKGITLVALVITIIVLLILAGVTLMLALGDNGILGQGTKARITQIEAEVKEQMQLAILSAKTDMLAKISINPATKFTQGQVSTMIRSALGTGYTVVPAAGVSTEIGTTNVTFTITYNGQDYLTATDNNGSVITRTCYANTFNLEDNDDTWSNYNKDAKTLTGTAQDNKI